MMHRLMLAAAPLALMLPLAAAAETAPAAVTALAPVPEGKLTDAAAPRGYRIDLTLDPSQERFSGKVEIDTALKRPARFIDLHGRDLAMKKAVAVIGGRTIAGTWHQLDDTGVARLVFPETLPAGDLVLAFEYDAPFQSGPAGLFRVKVADQWYNWSQFQSIDARAAFPGFDEPGFKTPFTVTLRTRPGEVAVSNAPQVSLTQENGWDVHRFAPTLPLPTYLVAVMTGPFAVAAGEVAPTPQRAHPLPLRIVTTQPNKDKMAFPLEGSKEIVGLLEAYFADGFPYPKLDQITSPIMPGAMENAGADLYADPILIMDEGAPTAQKRTFGMVVAHELAHQWFGDLVTPVWWDDIWLNESFANWMGYRIGHEWRPDLNIGAGALAEGFDAMRTDELSAGRPIHQPIERNAQIDEAFDTITYGKGGHVVAMTAGFMGDNKFRDGVRRYMKAHRYGSATSADFFGAMAEAGGDARILPAMQSFTDQQGVPLLTFARGKRGSYTVTQSRYAAIGASAPATRWQVPMCARSGAERHCALIGDSAQTVAFKAKGALVPNAEGTGYYRFELPKRDWDALIKSADKLPGGEALALADSLFASFRAGRASAGQLARLAEVLALNPDTQASDRAVDNLAELQGAGLFDDKAKAAFQRLTGKIYRPKLEELGFDPRLGAHGADTPERSQRRRQVVNRLSNLARDGALRSRLDAAAAAWLGGDNAALDPAFFGQAQAVRLAGGGLPAAEQLLERALASEDPVLRPAALDAIASSGDPVIARWVLSLTPGKLRQSEWFGMIRAVIAAPGTRDLGFEWLGANLDQLAGRGGGIFLSSRLPAALGGYCSVDKAREVGELLRPRYAGKTGALAVERAVERIGNCGRLKDARAADTSREMARVR